MFTRSLIVVAFLQLLSFSEAAFGTTVLGELNRIDCKVEQAISDCRMSLVVGGLITTVEICTVVGLIFLPDTIGAWGRAGTRKYPYEKTRKSLKKAKHVIEDSRAFLAGDGMSSILKEFLSNFREYSDGNYEAGAKKVLALNNSGLEGLFSKVHVKDFEYHDFYEEFVAAVAKVLDRERSKI